MSRFVIVEHNPPVRVSSHLMFYDEPTFGLGSESMAVWDFVLAVICF